MAKCPVALNVGLAAEHAHHGTSASADGTHLSKVSLNRALTNAHIIAALSLTNLVPSGQSLAYVYSRETASDARATSVAKLPEFLGRK